MKLMKKAGAWFLAMIMTLNIASGGLAAFAVAEDITCIISHFRLYDETEHALQDDDITVAKPGDIIAVTYALQNNASSRFNFRGWQQHINFNASALAYYEKDATDDPEDPQGDFAEHGYKCLLTMTPSVGNPSDGVTTVSVASSANVGISKNSTLDVFVVLYKVLDGASGNVTIQYAQNDNDFLAVGDEKITGTYSLGVPYSIPIDVPTHNVNVAANIQHGAVTSKPDNPVQEGATVTLTVAPEANYRLKANTLKATDAAGEIALTDAGNNTYTFAMRAGDVNVSAEFEPIHPDGDYNINTAAVPPEGGEVTPSKTTAKEGDVITLNVVPNTNGGYVLDKLTVTDSEGEIRWAQSSAQSSAGSDYTFTVRKSNVTVRAEFVIPQGPKAIQILPVVPAEAGTVTSEPQTEAVYGEKVTLTIAPDLNKGYVLKGSPSVKNAAGQDVQCTRETNQTDTRSIRYSFNMPDSAVTVSAEFYIPRLVNIPTDIQGGSVKSAPQEVGQGDTVTLIVEPETDYQLKDGFPKVTDANGEIQLEKVDEKTYTFVMGASDATVSAEFEPIVKQTVTVTYAPGEGSGDSKTETHQLPFALPDNPGFTPPSGKNFDGWTLPDGSVGRVGATVNAIDDGATLTARYKTPGSGGCYVATAVYGSYDCPEVWTLRRFRDHVLAKTWYGRLFIKLYYALSPTAVKLFGDTEWFQNFWRGKLDGMVSNLQAEGFESTPYQDMNW